MSNGTAFFKDIPSDVRIPGGCADCDAYQTVDGDYAPVYVLRIHHDDWCPTLARYQAVTA